MPGPNVIKLFKDVCSLQARIFALGRPGAYLRVEYLKSASFE
jgi:hypothetical protein